MLRVSVVVPTRGPADRVLRLLAPLLEDEALLEAVVVVDGADDGTREALEQQAVHEPRLRVVWQPRAGAGAARQAGVEQARGAVVLLLDDDVVPEPGLAGEHAALHAAHTAPAGLVVVGGMPTVPRVPRRVDSVTTDLYRADYAKCTAAWEADPRTVLDHLWGGHLSLPRDVALSAGLASPGLDRLYFEDLELGLRLQRAGLDAVFVPRLTVRHEHRRSLRRYADEGRRQGVAMVLLHQRYPERFPAPSASRLTGRAPWPSRLMVVLALRGGHVADGVVGAVLVAAVATGLLRQWRLQRLVATLLRRVAQAAGVAAAGPGQPGA